MRSIEKYERRTCSLAWGTYCKEYRNIQQMLGYCKQCHSYGMLWTCPPFDGYDPTAGFSEDMTIEIIGDLVYPSEELKKAVIAQQLSVREACEMLFKEARARLDKALLECEKEQPGSTVFFAGSCHVCPAEHCSRKKGAACRFPRRMRLSLEAVGFDLNRTASDLLHTEMLWCKPNELCNYFTLVSGIVYPK